MKSLMCGLVLSLGLATAACSSHPSPASEPSAAETAARAEVKKYPAPPTIFSHTMTPAHTANQDRTRYSPSAVFQLKGCEGCLFVYDETAITDSGAVVTSPGIGPSSGYSDDAGILNKFGVFHGGTLTSETSWAAMNIVKFCYHHLRLCKSEDPASCTALNPKLSYELDLETGRLNTNLPVSDPNLRKPAGETQKFRSFCPNLRVEKKSTPKNK